MGENHQKTPQQSMADLLAELNQRTRMLAEDMMSNQEKDGFQIPDPTIVTKAFIEAGTAMWSDPAKLMTQHMELWQDCCTLWQHTAKKMTGDPIAPLAKPAYDDKRFKDEAWSEDPLFDFLKQGYLLYAQWTENTIQNIDNLDEKTKKKVSFFTKQYIDALSPTNFPQTNPKVLRAIAETSGENLVRGFGNLLEDLERGHGELAIRMTKEDMFELGKNVATTAGKVIYQNELIQLIQYEPMTKEVYKRPLLVIPPWINKYYILDLKEKNSFLRWLVAQGFTVFVISWVNPDKSLAHMGFEDYMALGPLAATEEITRITGENHIDAISYCIGGTLLASTLAYMAAKKDDRIASATFLTTMMDFSEPGELGVFIDDEQLDLIETHMKEKGYLDGRHMAHVFNMLRDNDLIWSFVINNYLLGKDPFPFDLLYWNSDSTRMPFMMHSFYLRKMYGENLLVKPGGISLKNVPIDLSKITVPAYFLSTREDHIAPWKSTYKGTQILSGDVRFTLSGSGHIAGVVNPPADGQRSGGKYGYWTNEDLPNTADAFLRGATEHEGSWWPHWMTWMEAQNPDTVPARAPGCGKAGILENAPGSYVSQR